MEDPLSESSGSRMFKCSTICSIKKSLSSRFIVLLHHNIVNTLIQREVKDDNLVQYISLQSDFNSSERTVNLLLKFIPDNNNT